MAKTNTTIEERLEEVKENREKLSLRSDFREEFETSSIHDETALSPVPDGEGETVAALSEGRAEADGHSAAVLDAAADRAEAKAKQARKQGWDAAADVAEKRAEKLRRGDSGGSTAATDSGRQSDPSSEDLEAALSKARAKADVAREMGWQSAADTADEAADALTAALKQRGGETRAALSGETADSVLVDVGASSGAVARVSRSEGGDGLTVERVAEPDSPALSASQFNQAVGGATLSVTEADDGVPEVSVSTTGGDVTLPGVRETVEAPTSGAEPQGESGENQVAALQAKRDTAERMGWTAAAKAADEKIAALQGGEN